jgi:hypothetical protein
MLNSVIHDGDAVDGDDSGGLNDYNDNNHLEYSFRFIARKFFGIVLEVLPAVVRTSMIQQQICRRCKRRMTPP